MLVNCYVLFLYGVFTGDAVGVDFVGNAVVNCVEIVLAESIVPDFNTKKYQLYVKLCNIPFSGRVVLKTT